MSRQINDPHAPDAEHRFKPVLPTKRHSRQTVGIGNGSALFHGSSQFKPEVGKSFL
jgi:hypothetical protein